MQIGRPEACFCCCCVHHHTTGPEGSIAGCVRRDVVLCCAKQARVRALQQERSTLQDEVEALQGQLARTATMVTELQQRLEVRCGVQQCGALWSWCLGGEGM